MKDVDKILGIDETAAITTVPVNTLRFWRSKGVGPRSTKIGRRVVYRESDVHAWLDAQFAKAVGE